MWPWISRMILFIPSVSFWPTEAPKRVEKKENKNHILHAGQPEFS